MSSEAIKSLNTISEDSWLWTEDAARHLGVSSRWLEELRQKGGGPVFSRLGQRAVAYRRSELDRCWPWPKGTTARSTCCLPTW